MPHFKRKGAVQTGECLNSPKGLERHSPSDQSTLNATAEKGANNWQIEINHLLTLGQD